MCISQFQNCTDGSKDPLFSRRPFIQRFLKVYTTHTNIIRTWLSLWETGSDYLFSLVSLKKQFPKTPLRRNDVFISKCVSRGVVRLPLPSAVPQRYAWRNGDTLQRESHKSFLSSGMEMKKGFTESRSRSPKGCVHQGLEQRLNKKKSIRSVCGSGMDGFPH